MRGAQQKNNPDIHIVVTEEPPGDQRYICTGSPALPGPDQKAPPNPGDNDWVETIVNAPQTKADREQLLGVLESVKQRLEEQHDGPCEDDNCWICCLLLESSLSQVLADIRSAKR